VTVNDQRATGRGDLGDGEEALSGRRIERVKLEEYIAPPMREPHHE
jgi:hypothetical protein